MQSERAQSSPYFGFFDASIVELVEKCPWYIGGLDCVVTCMDSGTETAAMLGYHLPANSFTKFGRFGVLKGDTLLGSRRAILTGFDELFIFRSDAWRNLAPSLWACHFTSDGTQLVKEVPDRLLKIFTTSGALRYASDGCGLNVLATQEETLDAVAAVLPRASG